MKFVSMSVLLSLLPIAGGCVAVWGESYNVALANSRSVVIEYDPAIVNLPAMLAEAQAKCDIFGKDAVLDSVSSSNLGIKVNTYRCEARIADQVIDLQ